MADDADYPGPTQAVDEGRYREAGEQLTARRSSPGGECACVRIQLDDMTMVARGISIMTGVDGS